MDLLTTPFHAQHVACGGRMVDFAGWHMPVSYAGTLAEHACVRSSVGLFDVSHMGELRVTGPHALAALQHLVCNDVSTIPVGQSQYAALMNERGGIVDDLFIYRLGEQDYLVCINASNRDKDHAWFVDHNPHGAEIVNQSDDWAQVAVQGRRGRALVDALTDIDAMALERGAIAAGTFAGVSGCLLARTGYTGEDGFEVFLPAATAEPAWQTILQAGAEDDIQPIGLGARDTLRLEARNVLYGNDIDDDTSPLEAGLGWITSLGKPFVGRDVLLAQKEQGLTRRLVGLVVDKRIARPHTPILNMDGEVIGEVTSGSRSPTLGTNIALGYVKAERGNARPGNRLQVDIRGKVASATVAKGPFWRKDY
jgi:aminomethyltransferase